MKRLCVLLYLASISFIPVMGQTDSIQTDITQLLNNQPQFTWQSDSLPQKSITADALYYKLYMPLTFYRSALRKAFAVKWPDYDYPACPSPLDSLFTYDKKAFTQYDEIDTLIDRGLAYAYTHTYNKIERWDYEIEGLNVPNMYKEDFYRSKSKFIDLFKPEPVHNRNIDRIHVKVYKPNFWYLSGNGSVQFSQSYISNNWYEGGQSANALLSSLQFDADYNDSNKVEWDNRLEMKLGLQTAHSDTVHNYLVNDNLMRLTSKLGFKATTNWYYTVSFEFNTQLYNAYKTDSNIKQAGFLSPFNIIVGLGMDYKKKTKKIDLSMVLAPAAYNLCYVNDTDNVDVTSYGIKAGRRSHTTLGSTMTTNLVWTINPSIKYTTRLYYFSNYQSTQAEWENTINFTLNRYLSTKVYFDGRFDDSATKSNKWRYFQLKDILSFGLNYTW